MNIIVCIKQVPGSSNVKIDPQTGVLIRDGNNAKMNPYDLYALETALRMKESCGATVKTLSMGPPSARKVLEESLWMGCDSGVLLSDRRFGGADVVATSYTLSQGIRQMGTYDLIICGKQTTDGDTAQVGAEMAEWLQIPHVAYVDQIIEVKEKSVIVQSGTEKTTDQWEVSFPCLLTVDKGTLTPRLPSFKRKTQCTADLIRTLSLDDMQDKQETHYGLKGSPTQVERMFPPERNTQKILLEGTHTEQAAAVTKLLTDLKFI